MAIFSILKSFPHRGKCCVGGVEGGCRSNYESEKEAVKVHSFPSDPIERQRWVNALPNNLAKPPTKDMVVCILPPNYKTYSKKGHQVPFDPPSVFTVTHPFARQSLNAIAVPRIVKAKNVDADNQERLRRLQSDMITSWETLEMFCKGLIVSIVNNDDSMILTVIYGIPPRMTFSLQIFKDYSTSCYKGYTKVAYTDLVNSFTHKIEKYSQVKDIMERRYSRVKDIIERYSQVKDIIERYSQVKDIIERYSQ